MIDSLRRLALKKNSAVSGVAMVKKNETEQDGEGIKTTQLAAFGLLVGGVLTVFLFLALIVSSIPGTKRAPATETKADVELAPQPSANVATTAPQKQPPIVAEQSKTPPNGVKPRKKKVSGPMLKTPGNGKVYSTSVTPGKTPKMVQVQ
jgi:hypothetical protein